MTSRERLLAAIGGKPVDRIPVTLYEFHEYGGSVSDQEPSFGPLLELQKRYGETVVFVFPGDGLLGDPSRHASRPSDGHPHESETVVHTPKGPLRAVVRSEPRIATKWRVKPFIENAEDARRFLSIESAFIPREIGPLRDLERRLGENGMLSFNIGDPIGKVIGVSNFETFVFLLREDPGLVEAMLDRAMRYLLEAVEFINRHFGSAMVRLYGAEYAGSPLMDPRSAFRPLVGSYDTRLTEAIEKGGNFSVIHCHGRLKDLLEPIREMGADVLEPVEVLPARTADVTMEEVKAAVGDVMCIAGGMQAVDLDTGTPELIKSRVEAIVRAAGPTGLIILPTSTPIEKPLPEHILANYRAMFETVHALS